MDNNKHCLLKGNCELMVKLSCPHGQAMKHWYPLNKVLMQKFQSFPSITPTICVLSKNWFSRFRVLVSIAHCTMHSIRLGSVEFSCGTFTALEFMRDSTLHSKTNTTVIVWVMPVCNHMMEWIAQCTVETTNPEMTVPTSNHLRTPKEQMFILHRQELSTFNPEQSPRHLLYHIASWQARGAHSLPTVQWKPVLLLLYPFQADATLPGFSHCVLQSFLRHASLWCTHTHEFQQLHKYTMNRI